MYYTTYTTLGLNKKAQRESVNQTLQLHEVALGDGGGSYVAPQPSWTAITNEVWRGPINDVYPDSNQDGVYVIDAFVEWDSGGFTAREFGVYDVEGDLILVGAMARTDKPFPAMGDERVLYLQFKFKNEATSSIYFYSNPSAIIATQSWVTEKINETAPAAAFMLSNRSQLSSLNVAAGSSEIVDFQTNFESRHFDMANRIASDLPYTTSKRRNCKVWGSFLLENSPFQTELKLSVRLVRKSDLAYASYHWDYYRLNLAPYEMMPISFNFPRAFISTLDTYQLQVANLGSNEFKISNEKIVVEEFL